MKNSSAFQNPLPEFFVLQGFNQLLQRISNQTLFICFGILASWIASTALPVNVANAAEPSAEIVLQIGRCYRSKEATSGYIPVVVKEQLKAGTFVRTMANSQLGLLMADRTQIRLNQNSQLQIKSVGDSSSFSQATVRLNAGRAWSQARPQKSPGSSGVSINKLKNMFSRNRLRMETPSVTMSIRGTDWEVEVDPDGRTQLVVLSGVVAMDNEQGAVEVGQGESAVAEPGKAPVKFVLLNPAGRVQWVSSWKAQPARWVSPSENRYTAITKLFDDGDFDSALQMLTPLAAEDAVAAVLAADIKVGQGDIKAAINLLQPHALAGKGDPLAISLLARALARSDQFAEAEKLLHAVSPERLKHVEVLLAMGELAILQGDGENAKLAFNEVLLSQPNHAEAWYGLGLVEAERENVRTAKSLLTTAMQLNPKLSKAAAELAAVETFAGNTAAAEKLLADLLNLEPENYVALTARGINRLKAKRTQEALDDFLRVGLIEPRYARAWLYSGVAFYQLGESDRALQAFKKASALDVNDPIPYVMQSVVLSDSLEYGASIDAATESQKRMPFLKSLNQLANSQKGNANLGSALANFGMEEWATYYSDLAYSPYWAGSHLFRADRYTGKFNKNSELFKGFLTDPTVFGATNRNSSLVNVPGHYGRVDVMLERHNWQQGALIATLNGLTIEPVPFAYFVSGDLSSGAARKDSSDANGNNFTLGLGVKPRYDFGVFGFATNTHLNTALHTSELTDDVFKQIESRGDIGFNFKWAPDNQFWLKAGNGSQQNNISGAFYSQSTANSLNNALGTSTVTPNGYLDKFQSKIVQNDVQFRHALTMGNAQLAWGAETSSQTNKGALVTTFAPAKLSIDEDFSVDAKDAYLSGRMKLVGESTVQLDLFSQNVTTKRNEINTLDIQAPAAHYVLKNAVHERKFAEINPRFGIKLQIGDTQSLRLVGQKWRRSASAGTLSEVDTLGIQVNDKLPAAGGQYQRLRFQYDAQVNPSAYLLTWLDYERVNNGLGGLPALISGFGVTQLDSLRSRPEVFTPKPDLENTPVFVEGNISTFGTAANVLLNERQSVSANYLSRSSRQTGTNIGLRIPYIPQNSLQIGSQWTLPDRWVLGTNGVFRSTRYRDDLNLDPIQAGWVFGLTAYWETPDKKSSLQIILDNLLTQMKAADNQPYPHLVVRYSYRF